MADKARHSHLHRLLLKDGATPKAFFKHTHLHCAHQTVPAAICRPAAMEGGEAAQIPLDGQPFDIDLHPSTPVVAAGIITGQVELFRYGDDTPPRQLLSFTAHTESCRALRFLDEGRLLLSCSADKSILCTDATTGHKVARLENAHGAAINRMTALTETTLATGDDEGMIKVCSPFCRF